MNVLRRVWAFMRDSYGHHDTVQEHRQTLDDINSEIVNMRLSRHPYEAVRPRRPQPTQTKQGEAYGRR